MTKKIKFIDLFAGLGGMRVGLEQACKNIGLESECILTSEIKSYAIDIYTKYFKDNYILGDIQEINSKNISDFDILLAGFPCQPFSSAGTRQGFLDTRGTLFFEIERVLKDKQPFGFLLENVEGLVKHDHGKTLEIILHNLEALGYQTTCKVLNSADFGIPQNRKRIYIVGCKTRRISLDFDSSHYSKKFLLNILQQGEPTLKTKFIELLLSHYSLEELYGKAIKDKRGGEDNIHSWDIELKGKVSPQQKELLNLLLKQRRRKIWSAQKGIAWMDGIPLTIEEIATFYPDKNLKEMLSDLVNKGYLTYEHPKDLMKVTNQNGKTITKREYRTDLPKGYNIVVGKLSFEINKILNPNDISPTLVATDMQKLAVIDGQGLRRLTIREGLRLFGFPEDYEINLPMDKAYDLLGNTVVVPVIREISQRLIMQKLSLKPDQVYSILPVQLK